MGNCDLLSVSIKVKRKGEATVLRKKITYSKTQQWGRRIGHESVAAHFTSFASTDDTLCHCLPWNQKNKTKISDRQFLGGKQQYHYLKMFKSFLTLVLILEFLSASSKAQTFIIFKAASRTTVWLKYLFSSVTSTHFYFFSRFSRLQFQYTNNKSPQPSSSAWRHLRVMISLFFFH